MNIVRFLALLPTMAAATVSSQPPHPFVCTDYSQGKVFIVNTAGTVEWEYPAKNCNDLWVLPGGNLLFNTGHGVQEVTREKKVVFDYQSKSEIYACQRLDNGNTFIGECNAGRLLEVDPAGKVVKEIRLLPEGKDGGHAYIRNARKLANGHYLVCHYGAQVVREYDDAGREVMSIPAAGGPHSAARLPDGHTLIACGDAKCVEGPRVFEVDAAGKTVWEVKNGDLPGIQFAFMTGFQRLPNGNTLIANADDGQAIEVTREGEIVWDYRVPQRNEKNQRAALVRVKRYPAEMAEPLLNGASK